MTEPTNAGLDDAHRQALAVRALSESMWWISLLADKLDIDIDEAFATTMTSISDGLRATIVRIAP